MARSRAAAGRSRFRILLALVIAWSLCGLALCPAATPESVLVNAGFETGDLTGWISYFPTSPDIPLSDGIASGGTQTLDGFYARAQAGDDPQTMQIALPYIEQTVYLNPGQPYLLSAGVAALLDQEDDGDDGGTITVICNGVAIGSWSAGEMFSLATYGTLTGAFTPTQPANTIRIAMTRDGFLNINHPYSCIDSIAIVPMDPQALASVVWADPAPGTGVAHSQATISLTFNQALDPATVTPAAFTLLRSGGDGTFSDGNEVVVTPISLTMPSPFIVLLGIDASTAPDDLYRLTVSGTGATALLDVNGRAIDGEYAGRLPSGDGTPGGDFTYLFGISTAPTVTATVPADGAVAVAPASALQITFSKAMNQAATAQAFAISPPVAGTFSWLGTTLSFQPSAPLAANTAYVVTVGTGACDPFNAPLAGPLTVGFTTAPAWPGTPLAPGPIATFLHLGSTGDDAITGWPTSAMSVLWDNFLFAGAGYEYQQQPGPGQSFDMRVAQTQTPLPWTVLSAPAGAWSWGTAGANSHYYSIYVTAPTTRQAALAYSASGNVRGWLDGGAAPVVSDDTGSPSAPFLLTAGTHVLVFKTTNASSGGQFQIQITAPGGAPMNDLLAQFSDPIPPRLTALVYPATTGAVPLWSDVLFSFSEAMDTTVDPGTVGAIAPPVAGSWSWTDPTHLCFTPGAMLAASTTYTVSCTAAAAHDRSGNQLWPAPSSSFTTTTLSLPAIGSVAPTSQQRGAPLQLQLNGSGFIAGGIAHPPGALPYGGHLYAFYFVGQLWPDAEASCEALGGHLATISDAAEDSFVWLLQGRMNGYIGFYDTDEPNEDFAWVDHSPVTYTNWAQGEPNNFDGAIEDKTCYWWGLQWNSIDPNGMRPYTGEFDQHPPPAVRLVRSGSPDIAGTQVQLIDGGTLSAQFATFAIAPGAWDVVLTNPDGSQAVLSGGVTILNTPPVVAAGTLQVSSLAPTPGTLSGSDANGDPITFAIATQPAHGSVTLLDPVAGTYTYTVAAGYFGSDSFTAIASDGLAWSAPATITIAMTPSIPQLALPANTYDGWVRAGPAGPFQISGTASDTYAIASVTYTMTGATVGSGTASGTTAWTISTTLNTGTTIMVVTATNNSGNTAAGTRYLAADAVHAVVSVNFQDAASAAPAGYLADRGAPFGDRGNGWSYGWSAENPNGRNRMDPAALDQRYDTFTHIMRYGVFTWSLAVPNGLYVARIVCGDEQVNTPSTNSLLVNGIQVIDTGLTPRFRDYLVTVAVSDGLLSIGPDPSALNPKLTFLDLLPLAQADNGLTIAADGTYAATSPVVFTFSFGAPVAGFGPGAIQIGNGSAGTFTTIDAATCSLAVLPAAPGPVTVSVAGGAVATLAGGVPNLPANATITYDPGTPTALITPNGILTNADPVTFLISFSEPVAGFSSAGIVLNNGSLASFTAIDAAHYEAQVQPQNFDPGTIALYVLAGSAWSLAGTPCAAGSAMIEIDSLVPTAIIAPDQATLPVAPIVFTLTFDEDVSGLSAAGLGVTGGSLQSIAAIDGAVYQATVLPGGPGIVTLTLAAGAAQDAAGNPCTGTQAAVTCDAIDPLLTITPDQITTAAPTITFSFAFSEAVSGFSLAGIALGNGTAAGSLTTIDAAHYTLAVTPGAPGIVTVGVGPGAAQDGSGHGTPGASALVFYRTSGPQPALIGLANTREPGLSFLVQFDEPVQGFTSAGLTFANATLTSFAQLSPTTFAVQAQAQALGYVTIGVTAGAAQDAAGNPSLAVTAYPIYDPEPPSVTITPNDILVTGTPIVFTLTFSGFTSQGADPTLVNCTEVSTVRTAPAQYQISVMPTTPGLVGLSIGPDYYYNDIFIYNTVGCSASVIYTPVNLVITPDGGTTNGDPIPFQFAFTTPVTGFSAAQVSIANGTAGSWTAIDASHYQLEVTPTATGPVTVSVAAGGGVDASGNPSMPATATEVSDLAEPTISITPDGIATSSTSILFTLAFSEALSDFTAAALAIGNGTVTGVTVIDATHVTVAVAPVAQGAVTLTSPAGAFHGPGGDPSATASATVTFDSIAPTLAIAPSGTATDHTTITFTLTFSEALSDFNAAALTIANGILGTVTTVDATHVTVGVAVGGPGAVTLTCPAGAFHDLAGNPIATATASVLYDNVPPTVVITPDGISTNTAPIIFSLTLSKPLADFAAASLTIGNGNLGTVTALSATQVQVAVAPDGQGPVTLTCPGGAFHDAAGNPLAAAHATVTFDTIDPGVVITPNGAATAANPIVFTLTFSETLVDFAASALTIGNGTLGTVTTLSPTQVTVAVAPSGQGLVSLTCPGGAFHDAAGNPIASATASMTYDTTDPSLVISAAQASVAAGAAITLTCTFSVPVTTFTPGAMSISGATVDSLSGSGAVYALSVTAQDGPGTMTITVPTGAVSDMLGNPLVGTTFTLPITAAAGAAAASAGTGSSSSSSTKCGLGGGIASLGLLGALFVRRRWPTRRTQSSHRQDQAR